MANKLIYNKDYHLPLIKWMCRAGMIDEEISKELNIHIRTLQSWKKKYPELKDVMDENKRYIDILVEENLLKLCMGYKSEDIKTYTRLNKDGTPNKGASRIEKTVKTIEPDFRAIKFWLNNRQPGRWRDKAELELSGDVGINLSNLSDEDLAKELSKYE